MSLTNYRLKYAKSTVQPACEVQFLSRSPWSLKHGSNTLVNRSHRISTPPSSQVVDGADADGDLGVPVQGLGFARVGRPGLQFNGKI